MANKKTAKKVAASALLVGALMVGSMGMMAYFTDGDSAVNTFTIGKIEIDLEEPNWEEPEDITPNQEIEKDPQIENVGVNEAFVFMTVDIPYANVVTANADGTKNDAADTELFTYEIDEANWVQIGNAVKNEEAGVVTYTYAYSTDGVNCATLAKDATTPALFTSVTFANLVEDQSFEGTSLDIDIQAYAIQTSDVNGGVTAVADVWSVVANQAPDTTAKLDNAQ